MVRGLLRLVPLGSRQHGARRRPFPPPPQPRLKDSARLRPDALQRPIVLHLVHPVSIDTYTKHTNKQVYGEHQATSPVVQQWCVQDSMYKALIFPNRTSNTHGPCTPCLRSYCCRV